MAIALFTGGFLCLAYSLKTGIRRRGITAGVVFFIVISAFIFRSVYGVEFTHYDNFSHWALMVKHLMIKKRFPNYSDTIFSHISYPPGASAFIYYFVLISGIKSEWFQMFVQSVCMAGLISGLFCLAETIPGKLICSACSVILLSAVLISYW